MLWQSVTMLQAHQQGIAGGVILFLIALRMIFRGNEPIFGDQIQGEPFIVPLAIRRYHRLPGRPHVSAERRLPCAVGDYDQNRRELARHSARDAEAYDKFGFLMHQQVPVSSLPLGEVSPKPEILVRPTD